MIEPAAVAESARAWSRRRDRRRAFEDFLAHVAGGLNSPHRQSALRARFEDGLRRLIAARAVTIHEGDTDHQSAHPHEGRSILVDVPGATSAPVRIEAMPEDVAAFDEWDRQTLHASRHLAALVLAVDEPGPRPVIGRSAAQPQRGEDASMLNGSSSAICKVRERIERVAATDFTVLIEGESGTGKELVARQLHELSRRRRGPFVTVNCAALVESLLEAELFGIEDRTATGVRGRRGKFEHADQGTLFLDEVSDLSMSAQAKLLRAIQDMTVERVGGQGGRRVDVRLVVATNRRLLDLVERRQFRLDLFYRLNGVEIDVPPLRERREDILELAQCFLDRHRHVRPLTLSPSARDALLAYHWPGNVRELERVIERAIALAVTDEISLDDLPPVLGGRHVDVLGRSVEADETLRTWASRYARLMLERCGNNKRRACTVLGISYHTLQAHLRDRPARRHSREAGAALCGAAEPGTVAQEDESQEGSAEQAVWPETDPAGVASRSAGVGAGCLRQD